MTMTMSLMMILMSQPEDMEQTKFTSWKEILQVVQLLLTRTV